LRFAILTAKAHSFGVKRIAGETSDDLLPTLLRGATAQTELRFQVGEFGLKCLESSLDLGGAHG